MRHLTILVFTVLFASTALQAQDDAQSAGSEEDVALAVEAAKHWLAVVDSAGWAQSHTDAAQFFKASVAADVWIPQIRGARMPLGPFKSRELTGSQYATSLPGAPDGEYVVLTFSASFENKEEAVETVTPMKDPDGVWRVAGYYIR